MMALDFHEEKEKFHALKDEILDFAQLSGDAKTKVSERLHNMISYSLSRHDYYDEQKNKILHSSCINLYQNKFLTRDIGLGLYFNFICNRNCNCFHFCLIYGQKLSS